VDQVEVVEQVTHLTLEDIQMVLMAVLVVVDETTQVVLEQVLEETQIHKPLVR
tara:strand:- start:347 stop:505 length:159 start_codon:yes stop_codon:yes gene_type:complete